MHDRWELGSRSGHTCRRHDRPRAARAAVHGGVGRRAARRRRPVGEPFGRPGLRAPAAGHAARQRDQVAPSAGPDRPRRRDRGARQGRRRCAA